MLLPPAVSLGVDPIHFLIVMVITLTLGLVTPPVGVCLFAVAQVAKMSIEDVVKGSLAPMSILIAAIFALVLFSELTLAPIRARLAPSWRALACDGRSSAGLNELADDARCVVCYRRR